MSKNLTNEKFWTDYWLQKKLRQKISVRYLFSDLFAAIVENGKVRSAFEIGGFPGIYSIYLSKYFGVKTAFADQVVNSDILAELKKINGLDEEIKVYQGDIFKLPVDEKYDLVHSHGFIEHFDQLGPVIEAHVKRLNPGGKVLITLPNFTGFNGWIQQKFNPANYEKHNINIMYPMRLENEMKKFKELTEIRVKYYGTFSIWLDNFSEKSLVFKALFKIVWFIGKAVSKLIPVQSVMFSPYIVVTAIKR